MAADYSVVVVSRTPASSGPPTLVQLSPILDPSELEWANTLNRESECSFTCDPTKLSDDIKTRLLDLAATPLEVWVYRDDEMVFAGPIVSYTASDGLLKVNAKGLFYYTRYMDMGNHVWTSPQTFDAYDVPRQLLHRYATTNDTYSGFHGIDYDYDFEEDEWNNGRELAGYNYVYDVDFGEPLLIYDEIIKVGLEADFDFDIEPNTRHLRFYQSKGQDLSSVVFMDSRGIDDYEVFVSVAPDDFSTQWCVGAEIPVFVVFSDAVETFGRTNRYVKVDNPDTAFDTGAALIRGYGHQLMRPGGSFLPVQGAGVMDFDVGDTITYSYDFGLGNFSGSFRVLKKKVNVGDLGEESISVEFE